MTQEEKELLLKDLCGRLQHGVKVLDTSEEANDVCELDSIITSRKHKNNIFVSLTLPDDSVMTGIEMVRPYLRPMSSMTEEERKEWFKQSRVDYDCEFHTEPTLSLCNCHLSTDWLDKKMFDYRGLIPMGLALEAKEGMYSI